MKKVIVGFTAVAVLVPILLLGAAGAMLITIMAAAAEAYGCVPSDSGGGGGATPQEGTLTRQQMQSLILKHFPRREVGRAMAISQCESGWKVDNDNRGMNSDGTIDWGLFQLNDGGTLQGALQAIGEEFDGMQEARDLALDPDVNVRAAAAIFSERGWAPWVCAAPADHGVELTGVVDGLYSDSPGPNWDRYDQWGRKQSSSVTIPASLHSEVDDDADDEPPAPRRSIRSVVVYGDSLFQPLHSRLPDRINGIPVNVVAEEGRHTADAVGWLRDAPAPGLLVVSLGANDDLAAFRRDARAVVAATDADSTTILWGSLHGEAYQRHNEVLADLASAHSHVTVLPLASSAKDHVADDGLHLTERGYQLRAGLVRQAIDSRTQPTAEQDAEQAASGDCVPPGSDCPASPVIINAAQLQPNADAVARCAASLWPQLKEIGGWRPSDPYPYHPSGQAVDIMMPSGYGVCATGEAKELGDEIAEFFMKNWNVFRVRSVIWQQRIWSTTGKGRPQDVDATVPDSAEGMPGMGARGSCTHDHRDHVHVDVYEPDNFGETPPNFTGIAAADGGFGEAPARSGGGVMPVLPTTSRDYRNERVNPFHDLRRAGQDGGDPGPGFSNWRERCHAGWDIANATGDTIRAPMDGKVIIDGGDYRVIRMEHENGITSRYLHTHRYAPGVDGKTVTAGTVIGYVGGAGPSGLYHYGPHLHFETYIDGKMVDPRFLLFDNAAFEDAESLGCA